MAGRGNACEKISMKLRQHDTVRSQRCDGDGAPTAEIIKTPRNPVRGVIVVAIAKVDCHSLF